MPRAEHRRRSSAIGDARRPERAKPQAERMRRPELWAGRPSLLRRSGVRASQVAPLRTTFATFLHGATYGLVGLSACRNAASRNTPQVGAPFMTPVARKERSHRRNGCDGGDLGQGDRLCYAVPACGRHKWRPYVPRLQLFCMVRHTALSGFRPAVTPLPVIRLR